MEILAPQLGQVPLLQKIWIQFPAPTPESSQLNITAVPGGFDESGLLAICTYMHIYIHIKTLTYVHIISFNPLKLFLKVIK